MVTWDEIVRAEPAFADAVQAVFDAHKHKTLATLRKDGSRILTSMATAPVASAAGQYCGAIACVSDITARKQAEKTLRRTKYLKRLAPLKRY